MKCQKYYSSPRWTYEVPDCSMPLTFDTYSNCSYSCLYCFSQYQRAMSDTQSNIDYLNKQNVRHVSPEYVKRLFLYPDKNKQFGEYIKQRRVIQWGGLSDQFDGFEKKHGITLSLLRFFKELDYPICFSTKSVWWTKDERYMSLFRGQKNWNVKFSIITLDEQKANVIEAGCPTPQERLKAIETISKADCGGATLRLRPFIIGISTPSYLDLIKKSAENGATALSTEFFCFEQRSNIIKTHIPTINQLCGFDVTEFYRRYSNGSGYLRLNRKVKEPFIMNMKNICEENNMRFYVSDAHFKELCDNGSCCGLDESWNYSRGQFCEALQIARKKGCVKYSDISKDINELLSASRVASNINIGGSISRAKFRKMTIADYLRWLWNNPQSGRSPYKTFEGILIPKEKDKNGDLIYYYRGWL